MRTTIAAGALTLVLGTPVVAWAQAQVDLAAGIRALNARYNQSEGDEGGFGGVRVDSDQCGIAGSTVRCVIGISEGATDLDTGDSSTSFQPLDVGVATFAPDGRITTSREAFTEPVTGELGARLTLPSRPTPTRTGNVLVTVRTAVPAKVTIRGRFGPREIERGSPTVRTVDVPAGETLVAVDPVRAQRDRVRRGLRRSRSYPVRVLVEVVGDVGPANAEASFDRRFRLVRRPPASGK